MGCIFCKSELVMQFNTLVPIRDQRKVEHSHPFKHVQADVCLDCWALYNNDAELALAILRKQQEVKRV